MRSFMGRRELLAPEDRNCDASGGSQAGVADESRPRRIRLRDVSLAALSVLFRVILADEGKLIRNWKKGDEEGVGAMLVSDLRRG